jgi:signal transduction histidine kinase
MTNVSASQRTRRPVVAPAISPPPPFTERRRAFRREADRIAHEETRLLARALDVLAAEGGPEARLAGLLDLLAKTVGAVRAAVVADRPARRVAVAASDVADHPEAIALATWLDAAAPRSRARRAAAGPAPISIAVRARAATRSARLSRPAPHYACLAIPSAGEVTLGFAFTAPVDPDAVAHRLPPALARHAAVALALVTDALATERELHGLRARETESARFVSTVAHELRTPLTGLSGYLDLLLDGRVGDAEVERDFLDRGRTIVASMDALVGDLLELSRLESGMLGLEIGPFSVADALGAVASSLHPIALARGVEMHTDAPPRLRVATGDRRRVEQILTNLAANALKFSAEGTAIELTARFQGSVAILAIRDEGPGIEVDDRGRIFERFYRMADHARVTGTGLGLPIARDLARAMGGELEVASLPGTGSSFILVLPGPAGSIGAVGVADAVAAAVQFEVDRLRTLAALRAGSALAGSADPTSMRARRAS